MIAVIANNSDEERIPFCAKGGMLFFNCTKTAIDKAVENENRRKAYYGIGEWAEDQE